jgi:hypothetical protein
MPRCRPTPPALVSPLVWGLLIALAPALLFAGPNDVRLTAQLGWDGPLRSGRWMPLHVTASDPAATDAKPRAVRIDLEVPQGGPNVMQVHQYATIGPSPGTFTLLVPFRYDGGGNDGGPTVTLRDAGTGKTLARWPDDRRSEDGPGPFWDRLSNSELRVVGVVGEWSLLEAMADAAGAKLRAVQLPRDRLPVQPLGYDLLDVLVLNRANLNAVPGDVQQAMADWVRAGGTLLMWPGGDPVPPGPLADVLPCRVGRPTAYPVTPAGRAAAVLPDGPNATLQGFELVPTPDATSIPLWEDPTATTGAAAAAVAYTRRVGFGRATVAPFDISRIRFRSTQAGRTFYARVTDRLGLVDQAVRPRSSNGYNYGYYGHGSDARTTRLDAATSTLQDHLGDVPGAGRFGFSYVAWVVVGMMVLVGPVDWFVLKRLGRQPWTWVTTAGWIGLVTAGALSVARVFKSGELHYNTVEMIDQADDRVVGRVALTGIYSPRTTEYHLDATPGATATPEATGAGTPATDAPAAAAAKTAAVPPPGWWNVAGSLGGGSGGGLSLDTPFHQTADANAPDAGGFTVNVWNLRFLRGEVAGDGGDPLVKADLRLVTGPGGARTLEGTIRNLSDRPLTDVRVSVGGQFAGQAVGGQVPAEPQPAAPAAKRPTGNKRAAAEAEVAAATVDPAVAADPAAATSVGEPPAVRPADDAIEADEANTGPVSQRWLSPGETPVLVSRIGPGETVTVKAAVAPAPAGGGTTGVRPRPNTGTSQSAELWASAGDLAARRSERLELEATAAVPELAVVYATVTDPRPAATLREPPARQRHDAYLRAAVRLGK